MVTVKTVISTSEDNDDEEIGEKSYSQNPKAALSCVYISLWRTFSFYSQLSPNLQGGYFKHDHTIFYFC